MLWWDFGFLPSGFRLRPPKLVRHSAGNHSAMKKTALLSFHAQGQLTICLVLFSLMLALCGCAPSRTENVARVTGGNPVVGKVQIVRHGCPACHEISGIETARARVDLRFGILLASNLAGQLVNTPDNMIRWVKPQGIRPNSAMPTWESAKKKHETSQPIPTLCFEIANGFASKRYAGVRGVALKPAEEFRFWRVSDMSDPLTVYLKDHLAGSVQAVQLVEFLRDHHQNDALGAFATDLLNEIKADQEVLQGLSQRVGGGSSGLKELAAWFTEKVVRLKLKVENKDDLGTFEALEFLALGIQGKLALWRVLDKLQP